MSALSIPSDLAAIGGSEREAAQAAARTAKVAAALAEYVAAKAEYAASEREAIAAIVESARVRHAALARWEKAPDVTSAGVAWGPERAAGTAGARADHAARMVAIKCSELIALQPDALGSDLDRVRDAARLYMERQGRAMLVAALKEVGASSVSDIAPEKCLAFLNRVMR